MAALLSCATEIRNGIQTHIKKTENIEKIIERKRGRTEMQETSIPSLKYDLRRSKRKADEMITEVKRMKTEETDRITRLEQHVQQTAQDFETEMTVMRNQLTDTQNELKEMKIALRTGQTAYNFEKDLATYIYPLGTPITLFQSDQSWLIPPLSVINASRLSVDGVKLRVKLMGS
jgi:chromosome segregation ATPase